MFRIPLDTCVEICHTEDVELTPANTLESDEIWGNKVKYRKILIQNSETDDQDIPVEKISLLTLNQLSIFFTSQYSHRGGEYEARIS